jgi:hypothetical protein
MGVCTLVLWVVDVCRAKVGARARGGMVQRADQPKFSIDLS